MANFLKNSFVIALFSFVISSVANANQYEQLNNLEFEIRSAAGQLFNNTEHYRNTPNYTRLVDHCVELQQGASELAGLVRLKADIYQVEAKLVQLDQCFDRLSSLFESTEFEASQGRGVIQGDTTHVGQLLERAGHHMYQFLEVVTQIRQRIEYSDAPTHVVTGGEIITPIQPAISKQYFGHSPYSTDFGILVRSLGGSFGGRPSINSFQQQFISQGQFNQQRDFNRQFSELQRRQAEQQRRQVEEQRRQIDQQRRQQDQQRRQADQRRQQDQQRRQADQRRQQDQQRRQADQQRQRQAEQQRRQANQRRQQDQQRQRKSNQRKRRK